MKKINKIIAILLFITVSATITKAQLNPNGAQYYVNQYLANPAFAGSVEGFRINGGYRALWNNIPGAPVSQSITGEYGFNRVGLGLNVANESSGLLRQTRVVATYAYHINLDGEGNQLSFGVSGGFMSQRLDQTDLQGNPNDPMIGLYNSRKTYVDGDFGVAYTNKNLTIQAAIPNLKSFFKKDVVKLADESTFYSAISYKLSLGTGMNTVIAEPKFAYRGVRGFDNMWDAGVQVGIADQQLFFTGLYHSTESATMGFGMDFKKKYLISGLYTTQTSALSGYTNGSFELNLRLSLGK
ncbi:PorP/SprF family type IX secretion system membrane protein [Pedobacter nototheniae]|uniref:PorP/SprF family type IX secretion system membrane protein n=1 Tax=Pedobacter nototheniae TaxID=2488994 RepID=UPI00292CE76C|nr:PorP/SprF family type IX secretion system membrane protein [Pedobacter nototheniae]